MSQSELSALKLKLRPGMGFMKYPFGRIKCRRITVTLCLFRSHVSRPRNNRYLLAKMPVVLPDMFTFASRKFPTGKTLLVLS